MNTPKNQTITITINPAMSGQQIIEEATHAFFVTLQNAIDPQNKLDLGGFSSVNHEARFDAIKWQAYCILKQYEEVSRGMEAWVTENDIYLAYPNKRPTFIPAGTEVARQADGTFKTLGIARRGLPMTEGHPIQAECVIRVKTIG